MEHFLFLFILTGVMSGVFAVIAFVKKLQRRAYKKYWRIAKVCLLFSMLAFLIQMANIQWSLMLFFTALLLFVYGIFQVMVCVIRKLAKKDIRHAKRKAAIFGGTGFNGMIVTAGGTLSTILSLYAMFFFLAACILLLINIGRAVCRRKNKRLWILVPVCLGIGIVLVTLADYSWKYQLKKRTDSGEIYEEPIQVTFDFEVVDGETPIEIITNKVLDLYDKDYVYVYDEKDLHLLMEHNFATAEQCIEAIQNNSKIAEKFKTFFCEFVRRIEKTYPGLNLAVLYHNLATLDVQELSANDYFLESLSMDSLGCYNMRKNTIFIPEGTVYVEGEFGFQVLIHEFCHALRSSYYETSDKKCYIDYYDDNDNRILMEAMNSVFSCSLLNYYEWDIAYQVASNYLRIMLECMDNYSLEDYVNHRDTYFLSKLDEFMGKTNYAQVIWKLIALQRSDWEQENMDIPIEEYYPIYDFLCEMYYDKYITEDMTDEEKRAVADELIKKAFYDAPEDYKIDEDYFYEYLGLTIEE